MHTVLPESFPFHQFKIMNSNKFTMMTFLHALYIISIPRFLFLNNENKTCLCL